MNVGVIINYTGSENPRLVSVKSKAQYHQFCALHCICWTANLQSFVYLIPPISMKLLLSSATDSLRYHSVTARMLQPSCQLVLSNL